MTSTKLSLPLLIRTLLPTILAGSYNYNKPEDGIWWNSKKAMQYNHCMMVLTGDAADNVTGLGKLSPEIIEKYSLRSTKGVGKGEC